MQTQINIAFFIDQIDKPVAGTEIQVLRLIKSLTERNFNPFLIVLRSSNWLEKNFQAGQYYVLNIDKIFSLSTFISIFRLRTWLTNNRIQIIQTFFKDANIIGVITGIISAIPLIISGRRNLGYDDNIIDKFMYRLLDTFIDHYITNSLKIKVRLVEFENVKPHKIKVFHNLVEVFKDESSNRINTNTGLDTFQPNDTIFLMVANLRPVKSHHTLLNSVKNIADRVPNSKFVLVGGGSHENHIKRLATELNINHKVVFAGLQQDVIPFLCAADVGILCSLSEGFSSTLLEYIAFGLPCIATNVGSNYEMVIDGYNGFLVEPDNTLQIGRSILKLYSNPKLRATMGQNSLKLFKAHFRPDILIREIEDFYIDALSQKLSRV